MLGLRMEELSNLEPEPAIQLLAGFNTSRGQRMSHQQSVEKTAHDKNVPTSCRLSAEDELRRNIGKTLSTKRFVMKPAHAARQDLDSNIDLRSRSFPIGSMRQGHMQA
jgi:hypothetical protein